MDTEAQPTDWSGVRRVAAAAPLNDAAVEVWRLGLARELGKIAALDPEAWRAFPEEGKLAFFRDLEAVLAQAQGRPAASVEKGTSFGSTAQFIPGANTIGIGPGALRSKHPRKPLDAFLHEDRHAFQFNAIQSRSEAPAVVEWRRNSDVYVRPSLSSLGVAFVGEAATIVAIALIPVAVPALAVATVAAYVNYCRGDCKYRTQALERDAWKVGATAAIIYPKTSPIRRVVVNTFAAVKSALHVVRPDLSAQPKVAKGSGLQA